VLSKELIPTYPDLPLSQLRLNGVQAFKTCKGPGAMWDMYLSNQVGTCTLNPRIFSPRQKVHSGGFIMTCIKTEEEIVGHDNTRFLFFFPSYDTKNDVCYSCYTAPRIVGITWYQVGKSWTTLGQKEQTHNHFQCLHVTWGPQRARATDSNWFKQAQTRCSLLILL